MADTPHRLDALLRPRSIAVLGATERAGTVGRTAVENLLKGGFDGALYAVNPRYASVCGVRCFASLGRHLVAFHVASFGSAMSLAPRAPLPGASPFSP